MIGGLCKDGKCGEGYAVLRNKREYDLEGLKCECSNLYGAD